MRGDFDAALNMKLFNLAVGFHVGNDDSFEVTVSSHDIIKGMVSDVELYVK